MECMMNHSILLKIMNFMKRLLHYKCNYKVLKDPEYLLNMTNNISSNFSKEQKGFLTW